MPAQEKPTGGYIAGYGLTDWWRETFSDDERCRIEESYKPFNLHQSRSGKSFTEGPASRVGLSVAGFLWSLSSWFEGPNDRNIARKILCKADEANTKRNTVRDILDEHFTIS